MVPVFLSKIIAFSSDCRSILKGRTDIFLLPTSSQENDACFNRDHADFFPWTQVKRLTEKQSNIFLKARIKFWRAIKIKSL